MPGTRSPSRKCPAAWLRASRRRRGGFASRRKRPDTPGGSSCTARTRHDPESVGASTARSADLPPPAGSAGTSGVARTPVALPTARGVELGISELGNSGTSGSPSITRSSHRSEAVQQSMTEGATSPRVTPPTERGLRPSLGPRRRWQSTPSSPVAGVPANRSHGPRRRASARHAQR